MDFNSFPQRPLYLHEINVIDKDTGQNFGIEPVFFKEDNRNAVICVFITYNDIAHIIGYDKIKSKWVKISKIDEEVSNYDSETDNILDWFINRYGSGGYGVYKIE